MSEIIVLQKKELESLIYQSIFSALSEFQKQKKIKENMSISEAAKYLSLSESSIERKKRSGEIKFSKLGGRVIYKKSVLDEYRDANLSVSAIQKGN